MQNPIIIIKFYQRSVVSKVVEVGLIRRNRLGADMWRMGRSVAVCLRTILASGWLPAQYLRRTSPLNRHLLIIGRWKSSNASSQTTSALDGLRRECITIRTQAGEEVQIDAAFQDTMPSGSSRGTVIGVHGSPGSYHHFDRFYPCISRHQLRFIGVNFPGYGIIKDDPRLNHDSHERVELVVKLVERLRLNRDLIFVGHSRGSETALRLGVVLKERTRAIVLVNPLGFRPVGGMKPLWTLHLFNWLWDNVPATRPAIRTLAYCTYNYSKKVKAETSEMATNSFRTLAKLDWAAQRDYVRAVNENHLRVFIAHAGSDPFIETEIAWNFLESFDRIKHLTCEGEGEDAVSEQVRKLIDAGERQISVFFPDDRHHLQKHRAEFLANVVTWMMANERA